MKSKLCISQWMICSIFPQRIWAATRDRKQAASNFLQISSPLDYPNYCSPILWLGKRHGRGQLWGGVGSCLQAAQLKGEFQVCIGKEVTAGWRKGTRKHLACSWTRNSSRLVHTEVGREGISSFLKRRYAFTGERCVLFSKYLWRVEWVLLLFHSCSWATRV